MLQQEEKQMKQSIELMAKRRQDEAEAKRLEVFKAYNNNAEKVKKAVKKAGHQTLH